MTRQCGVRALPCPHISIVTDDRISDLPMTVLDGPMDLACVETQIGNGDAADCEIVMLEDADRVLVNVQ